MNHPIDYPLIARAIDFYGRKGFRYIEAPWMAHHKAVHSTLPKDKTPFYLSGNYDIDGFALVGSAEQAFVQLMLDGKLPLGSHMAAGPCFRDDEVDELHQKTFFKIELIIVMDYAPSRDFAYRLASDDAFMFLTSEAIRLGGFKNRHATEIVPTETGYDINLNDIEIGSYGVRSFEGHHWIYGTGLAEPRFSMALAKGEK